MTQESKLGLLIGVAMVLFVCIVVSDLMAVPTNSRPADLSGLDPRADVLSPNGTAARVQNEATEVQREALVQTPDAFRRVDAERRATNALGAAGSGANIDPSGVGAGVLSPPAERPYREPAGYERPQTSTSTNITTNAAVPNGSIEAGNGAAVDPITRAPVVTVEVPRAPQYETVRLRSGESLSHLAARHLGDPNRWREIVELNADVITNPDRVPAGTELKIPNDAPNDTALPEPVPTRVIPVTPQRRQPRQPSATTASTSALRAITVGSGETLSDIARREFNDAGRWRDIYAANRSAIGDDPNRLEAGTRLVIPR